MARKDKTPAVTLEDGPAVLVPSTTAFDFLDGRFVKTSRARLKGLACAGVGLVVIAGVALTGTANLAVTAAAQSSVDQAQSHLSTVQGQLAVLDAAEGIPSTQISSHLTARRQQLADAIGSEVDVVGLLTSIQSSAPTGVTINGVTFASGAGKSGTGKSTTAPVPSTAPTPRPSSSGHAGATADPITVQVTATATSFAVLPSWSTALSAMAGLSAVDLTWSGGGNQVQVTVTATVTDAARSVRGKQAVADAAKGTTTPAATTTASTPAPTGAALKGAPVPTGGASAPNPQHTAGVGTSLTPPVPGSAATSTTGGK